MSRSNQYTYLIIFLEACRCVDRPRENMSAAIDYLLKNGNLEGLDQLANKYDTYAQ